MRNLLVVISHRLAGSHLAECAEGVHVEHATSIAAVEAFNEAILHRAPRLNEVLRDALGLRPFGQRRRDELRAVVQAQFVRVSFVFHTHQRKAMATYKDLLAQKAKLDEQLEAARAAEVETAIAQVRQIVLEYGLTAEDLGLATKAKKRKGGIVPPKYQDPKSGATWTGRGRAPAWIAGKNFDRYLIK